MKRIKEYKKLFKVEGAIDLKELKTTYRGLVKEWHPDKFQEEEKKKEAGEISLKIIDKKAVFSDLKNADLVVLSIPVDVSVNLIVKILEVISDNTLVVDVGSTKLDICKEVSEHPKRRNFLAMHPIAGTEFSGPKAAIHGLFEHKTN